MKTHLGSGSKDIFKQLKAMKAKQSSLSPANPGSLAPAPKHASPSAGPREGKGKGAKELRASSSKHESSSALSRLQNYLSSDPNARGDKRGASSSKGERIKPTRAKEASLLSAPEKAAVEHDEMEPKNKKSVEVELKNKKKGLVAQPPTQTSPNSLSTAILAEMEGIFEKMPLDRKEMERSISSYLGKLKYLALAKAETMLKMEGYCSPSELIKLSKELTDMQLALKWTRKLEKVILENPSKLMRPGSGSWTLLSRVKEMAVNTMNEQKKDGRNSGVKKANHLLDSTPSIDLPSDMEDGDGSKKEVV